MHVIISYLSKCTCGRARKKYFLCHMASSLTSIVYSKLKQHAYLCAGIENGASSMMSAITAWRLCQASIRSKNSAALFSTTTIHHKLTYRIVYLLEVSGNKSIISHRYMYYIKISFPLYTNLTADCCLDLGLGSGLSTTGGHMRDNDLGLLH